jgi:hypothetical protein
MAMPAAATSLRPLAVATMTLIACLAPSLRQQLPGADAGASRQADFAAYDAQAKQLLAAMTLDEKIGR